ncbi:hypothetical protein [Thioalkalivibrio sulfidiphilus]|uniref:hypothetical protein n=1 Tax=Thioalkalivibrio sulfidiphilus TaxID=1033854 RepID=UPI00247A105A|nr:hypothetical protein [Thioalkalivibrio sulfidiphilus]
MAEQAGGRASDGVGRILERKPVDLHERVPFFVGSRDMVSEAERFLADPPPR